MEPMTKPGDVVVYSPFGGGERTVIVEQSDSNIKNGEPGFDGTTLDGEEVWGYDDQILWINGKVVINLNH